MTSESKFQITLYETCKVSFSDFKCYYGLITAFIGFIFFLTCLFAFCRMMKYFYRTMNFETTILLLCSVQILIVLIEIITSHSLLRCIFNYIHILNISLIIHKFKKVGSNFLLASKNNSLVLISLINTIYLLFFSVLMIVDKNGDFILTLNIIYNLLVLIVVCILTYYCCLFLSLIKKYKGNLSFLGIEDINNYDIINSNNSINTRDTRDSLRQTISVDGIFYSMKKRQLTLLYLLNLICAILEVAIPLIYRIFNKKIIFVTTHYNRLPSSNIAYILYYSCFILFFIHCMINYLCFYWIIRDNYNLKLKKLNKNLGDNGKGLLDEKFINDQSLSFSAEDKEIEKYLYEQQSEKSKRKRNNRYTSSSSDFSLDDGWTIIGRDARLLNEDYTDNTDKCISRDSTFNDDNDKHDF